jgi:hypothetical protein
MRKIQLLGLAVFAVFAFSAVAEASSAFALESMWLVKGAAALTKLLADSEGELQLTDLKTPIFGEASILCSFLKEGFVGGDASGANPKWDEITSITGLNAATEPLWIKCTFVVRGGCETTTPPEIMPVNLPWLTELLLTLEGTEEVYLDDLIGTGGNTGWVSRCLVLGANTEDECTSATRSANIDNTAESDVKALFSETIGGLASCSQGGAESGIVTGEMLILLANGEALAVSEGDPAE